MAAKKKVAKKKASRKGVGGRPSKFGTVDKEQVEKLALAGWTDAQMAEFFKVDERTWHRWKDADPKFCQSLKDWKVEADSRVERSLFERATGYSHPEEKLFQAGGEIIRAETTKHYPPDTTAMIFWLKNRKPEDWRDKQEIEHHGLDQHSPDEIKQALQQKLKALQAQGIDIGALLK